jgi:hypothetical protein
MARHTQLNHQLAAQLSGGRSISSGEYLAGFMFEMGRVQRDDVIPVLQRFSQIDADGEK